MSRWVILVFLAAAAAAGALSAEVIVEEVGSGGAAAPAGLEVGDALVSWLRLPSDTVPDSASGPLTGPFEPRLVEIEQAGIAPVTFEVFRDGETIQITVTGSPWSLKTRPVLAAADLSLYERGRGELEAGDLEAAERTLRALADRWEGEGSVLAAAWLRVELARRLADQGGAEAAGELHRAALDGLGPDADPRVRALLLESWGNHHLDRAENLDRAEELHGEALEIRSRLDPGGLAVDRSLDNLSFVALQRGDLTGTVDILERRRELLGDRAPRSQAMADVLHNLGYMAWYGGNLIEADQYLAQAWRLKVDLELPPEALTSTLLMLGTLAQERRDLDTAEGFLRRVLDLRERHQSDPHSRATAQANLASLLQKKGEWAESERLFRRSLEIRERIQPGTIAHAATLWGLGTLLHAQGDLAGARALYQQALPIQESAAAGTLPVGVTLVSLGVTAAASGELLLARSRLRRGLEILRQVVPDGKQRARAAFALYRVERRLGDREAAIDSCREAVETLERSRDKLGGSFEQQAVYGETVAEDYFDCVDLMVAVDRPEEAFAIHERAKARTLRGLFVDRGLDDWPGIDAEVAARIESARESYEATLDELRRLGGDLASEERRQIAARLDPLQRALSEEIARARTSFRHQASLQAPSPLAVDDLRGRLRPGTLALSYALGPDGSFLFALGPDGDALGVHRLAAPADELEREIGALRSALERPSALGRGRLEQAAGRLGEWLLAPVAERLTRAERLLVAPEGSLFFLPFAVLAPPGGSGGMLLETHAIQVSPSLTLALELEAAPPRKSSEVLIAFADPAYPEDAETGERLRGLFELGEAPGRLPETRREAAAIAGLRPGSSRLYVDLEATEERAKTVSSEARYLHFATHAIADSRSPMESALLLTMPENRQAGQENGVLQAWEVIESIKLDAELVTLSACETGLGREVGAEGVVGLPTAFLYAGARNVLASLWRVSDRSTARLMERFYAELLAGTDAPEALRRAQLAVARDVADGGEPSFSHPFYWASFQLIGGGR